MARLFFVAVTVGLIGMTSGAEDPKLPGPKIDFPDVKGFTKTPPRVYPQAGLGYSVAYGAPGVVATVYVYNNDLTKIPDGVKSQVVVDEIKQAAGDLEEARKQGLYKSVKEIGKEGTISLGKGKNAPVALKRKFEVERTKEPGEKLSEIYLTGYKNNFIKVRITYEPEGKEESEKKIAALLEAIGTALK